MAFTYDATQMQSATAGAYTGSTVGVRTQIRWLIQDVQSSRVLLQDAEIDWCQTLEANAYLSAALCCEVLVVRAGNVKARRAADLSLDYDPGFYRGLAAQLRAKGMTAQVPYAGGISVSDKAAQDADTDRVPPTMFRGEFDHPGATQPAPGPTDRGNPLTSTP